MRDQSDNEPFLLNRKWDLTPGGETGDALYVCNQAEVRLDW
jgi:hypothetical protein